MCTDVDYFPKLSFLLEQNLLLSFDHICRSTLIASTSSMNKSTTSWWERKLFTQFKRVFRRNLSSSTPHPPLIIEEIPVTIKDEQIKLDENSTPPISLPIVEEISVQSVDPLDDYDQLLTRCFEKNETNRNEMIQRLQTFVKIPHADLLVGQSCSLLTNWKSYVRLFRTLKRDPTLFQLFINQSYSCQSSINQHDEFILNIRTTRVTFDHFLQMFLDRYVTCLKCEKAETNLIKTRNLWFVECQFCGTQRIVERLRWKRSC